MSGQGDGDRPEVGSLAEEAAKLFGVLNDWAHQEGSSVGGAAEDLLGRAGAAAREVNDHLATGAEECRYCPVCRMVHAVRQCSPDVRAHLGAAAVSLAQAFAALLATDVGSERRGGVEHIDLGGTDEDWDFAGDELHDDEPAGDEDRDGPEGDQR